MQNKKLFKSIIYCHCGRRMTPTKQSNGSILYICSDYHHSKGCSRENAVYELDLLMIVKQHGIKNNINIPDNNNEMKKTIKKIIMGKNDKYTVEFTNGRICGWISPNTLAL